MISPFVVPHGGWVYEQKHPDGRVIKIEAGSFDSLVGAVEQHRRINGMVCVSATHDVLDQIEEKHPYLSLVK